MNFVSENTAPVSEADLIDAAKQLACEMAAIKAVCAVEAPHGGFISQSDGRPVILFESHAFHTYTGGRFDAEHPDISTPTWEHNYGAGGAHQYERLGAAMNLDREAALKSASWGKFQIMGGNFSQAGYDNVDAFVADMVESEAYQLDAFVAFILNSDALTAALRSHNWIAFARGYNGPGQVEMYSQRIEDEYAQAARYEAANKATA